jgi:hypothetical protein
MNVFSAANDETPTANDTAASSLIKVFMTAPFSFATNG